MAKSETPVESTEKNVSFGATIPAEYADRLEDYRWSNRMKRPEFVRKAIDFYAASVGIEVPADSTAE